MSNYTTKGNKSTQQSVSCTVCGEPTTSLGTKLCDRCWELQSRIERDPVIARRIIHTIKEPMDGDDMHALKEEITKKIHHIVDTSVADLTREDAFEMRMMLQEQLRF